MMDDKEKASNIAAIVVACSLVIASVVGVIVFYPSALAQSNSHVRQSEIHAFAKLPLFIKPTSYEIHLHPKLETGIVEGQERIVLTIEKLTTRIAVHMHAMNITGLNLRVDDEILTASLHTEHEKNLAYFSFQRPVGPGQCILEVSFRYHLRNESMTGAFLKSHNTRFGERKATQLIATYLTPTHGARTIFPCFDDPRFPANITLSIVAPEGFTALSTTQATEVTHLVAGGMKVRFAPTQSLIAPHQLSFVLGNFKSIETTTKDGILLRVWAEEGFQIHSRLALRLALDGLEFLQQQLGVSFPVKKVDLVALQDFVEDMKQSTGLCMFHESRILYDISLSPSDDRWRIATAVWRCLASHWFTDQTMRVDVDHSWLPEALATLFTGDVFSSSSALRILGGSGLTDQGGDDDAVVWLDVETIQQALEVDAMPHTHPLVPQKGVEGTYVFDEIFSHKGASVLNMFRVYMNSQKKKTFELGVQMFLKNGTGSPRTSVDFLETLDIASGLDVSVFARPWVSTAGYPLLDVSTDLDTITVRQRPFSMAPGSPLVTAWTRSDSRWHVPLAYISPAMHNGSMITLVADSLQTRIRCPECLVREDTTETPSPSPLQTPTATQTAMFDFVEVMKTNGTANNTQVLATLGILVQTDSKVGGNVTNGGNVSRTEVPLPANTSIDAAVALELVKAKEEIAALQAANVQAQKHILELEDQLKAPTSTAKPTPTPTPRPPAIFDDGPIVGWVKLNKGQTSFVRINYPVSAWKIFQRQLRENPNDMDPIDRAGLLDDAFNLALSGDCDIPTVLALCQYLVNETHPLPWKTALRHLRHISSLGYEEPWVEMFYSFVLSFLEPAIFNLNLIPNGKPEWKPHPLTSILLEAAVDFKSVSVTAELTGLFPGGLTGLTSLSLGTIVHFFKSTTPDVRCAVLQAMVASGAPGAFEAVLSVFRHSVLPSDRRHALRALSMSKNHHERIRLLNLAIEADLITSFEALLVFEQMAHNHEGRSTVWRKVKDNWEILHQRYSHGDIDIGRLVFSVVSPFTSTNQHHDIKEFFDGHNHKGADVAVAAALETVAFNAEWMAKHSTQLEKTLHSLQKNLDNEAKEQDDPQVEQRGFIGYEEHDEDLLQLPLKMVSVS